MSAASALKATRMSGKGTFLASMAPSLAGGAPSILRMAPSWAKRTCFVLEGRLRRWMGCRYYLEGVVMGKVVPLRVRRALLLAGGAPYML